MRDLLKWLEGKKSHIIAVGIALVTIAKSQGWIDVEVFTVLMGLLGGGGLAALRAGVKKQKRI